MATALPDPVRLKLEQTLSQWRHWHTSIPLKGKPRLVRQLGAGISNYSLLVEAQQRYVVRIDGVNPTTHGLNRQAELHSLNAAHREGLAPKPCYLNPDLGSLVSEYLQADAAQPLIMQDVAALFKRIHQLPAQHRRLDLRERIRRYERSLQHRHADRYTRLLALGPEVNALLDATELTTQPMVLCHNDLLQANRLYSGGRLFALDWEYSGMGSACYDLAVVIAGDNLDTESAAQLMAAYGLEAGGVNQVLQYACIYDYLEILWYQIEAKSAVGNDDLDTKIGALEQKLSENLG